MTLSIESRLPDAPLLTVGAPLQGETGWYPRSMAQYATLNVALSSGLVLRWS